MNSFFAWAAGLLAIVIPGFGAAPAPSFSGYVEAKYVYVAPASAGIIDHFAVREGEQVKKGDLLFTLNSGQQQALVAAAARACCWLEARVNSRPPFFTCWPSRTAKWSMMPAVAGAT